MYQIELQPCGWSAHLDQILAGLIELESQGYVALSVSADAAVDPGGGHAHLLHAQVDDGVRSRSVIFDMRDGADIEASAVRHADICFKRAFNASLHAPLRDAGINIQPCGFNYACVARDAARHVSLKRQLGTVGRQAPPASRMLRSMAPGVADAVARARIRRLTFDRFEAAPEASCDDKVIYIARLWSLSSVPGYSQEALTELNEVRIALVRSLRLRLGNRFTGGLENDPLARHMAPDCIFRGDVERTAYLRLMQRHRIGVASPGLHESVGWKFAEYIAASRCVVAPRLPPGQDTHFIEGIHYITWQDPDACAEACDTLLSEPDRVRAMQIANAGYYANHLRPDQLVLNNLRFAMDAG
jgi:glycosyltransferase involved in cell wall biosynthesis